MVVYLRSQYTFIIITAFCFPFLQVTILAAVMTPPRLVRAVSSANCPKIEYDSSNSEDSTISGIDKKFDTDSVTVSTSSSFKSQFRPLIHWRMILLLSKSFIRGWSSGVYYVLVPYFVQQYGFSATRVTYLYMVGGGMNISIRILLIIAGEKIMRSML